MKVLGFRADPTTARYAIVEESGGQFTLLNENSESRLKCPANVSTAAAKMHWLYRELERILGEHSDISGVVIKTNEFTRSDNKAKRETAHLEAVLLLLCAQKQIPVDVKLYASLGASSSNVKSLAEQRVGRTSKHWDNKMADAVIAAWRAARP